MDPKTLTRLVDAAARADLTLADVLALCTRGDDLHLDIYVTPPPSGWSGEEWLDEDHLDLPDPDGNGYVGKSEPVGSVCLTAPILLPVEALRPWKGVYNLHTVALGERDHLRVRSRSYVRFESAIQIPGDLLEVVKHQWAGWAAQHAAGAANADERERLTRRVTAAVQAGTDEQFAWKTEEAAKRLSKRFDVSRATLSKWLLKAAEKGLPIPARRRTVGRSRADFWLSDVGLLAAWATLVKIEGTRGRAGGGVVGQPEGVKVEPKPGRRKKRGGRSHEDNLRRLAEARKKGR